MVICQPEPSLPLATIKNSCYRNRICTEERQRRLTLALCLCVSRAFCFALFAVKLSLVDKGKLLYAVIGIFIGFVVGFIFTNNINRRELVRSTTPAPSQTGVANTRLTNGSPDSLSEEEIREAIAKTDSRPDDIDLQRNFGLALYRYSNQTQDTRFLPDVARFLKRVYDSDPKDRNIVVSLGNVLFDIGQASDPESFKEARIYYTKALEMKPDDPNVRTDLGLTYFFGKPSEPNRAIAEYRKSLAINPRHEPTLQNLATALISTGNREEAQRVIEQLQSINPSNPALNDLRAQLAQSKNASQ
jgi:hypothetical protein